MARAAAIVGTLLVLMSFAGIAASGERGRAPTRTTALEQRVRLLTAELRLDADQQGAVRAVLERQRAQTWRIWNSDAVPPEYRIKATQSVAEEAANGIRKVLNEQQRARFSKPRSPAAEATITRSNVEEWLRK